MPTNLDNIPRVVIDHSRIPAEHLEIAKFNASRDPDGQTFPWRHGYPLADSTVYYKGQLWIVAHDSFRCITHLTCGGHVAEVMTVPEELRPITWTQAHEDALQGAR